MSEEGQNNSEAKPDDGWEWAFVEIMGHRSHYGRCREEERFGQKLIRVDVPIDGAPEVKGWVTHYYGGASLFSYTLTTMEAVFKANKPYVSAYIARHRPDPEDDDEELSGMREPLDPTDVGEMP